MVGVDAGMAVGSPEKVRLARPGERARNGHARGDSHSESVFRHEVILHGDGADGFVSQTTPLVGEPREDDAPVLVAVRRLAAMAGAGTASSAHGAQARRPFDGRLEPSPAEAQTLSFDEHGLPPLRRAVTMWADANGLRRESIEELVLAVDEIATNSIRYGGGEGTLRMWREDDRLLCEISDCGHMKDPLLGRVRPGPDALSGRGLWIVNHLCDLVQIRSSAADGSQVRMHKKLA